VRQTDGVTFVRPVFWAEGSDMLERWRRAMQSAEDWYMHLLSEGATPQEARTVLPNSAKTEIVVTGNLRAWRHMLGLRTAKDAHPQIRALMTGVQLDLQEWLPEVFSG
jgi:thymidylate synthase (FAD)